jgi:adenylate cyclase
MLRIAGKRAGEPLAAEDWAAYFRLGTGPSGRLWKRVLSSLPTSPRCGICGAPFAGAGSHVVRRLGYRPSRKNPALCATCVELSPPGGMTMQTGVFFADLRGFTALAEELDPEEVSVLLRRFYGCVEKVLFPQALIDKLIGDAVMALYIPMFGQLDGPGATMVNHARGLLAELGYGSSEGPFVELGIGLDYGEAFVGNIGDRSLYDFTAVGDVVNTAARLQDEARGGEIVLSARLASQLNERPGEPIEVMLKGKSKPLAAHRLSASGDSPT